MAVLGTVRYFRRQPTSLSLVSKAAIRCRISVSRSCQQCGALFAHILRLRTHSARPLNGNREASTGGQRTRRCDIRSHQCPTCVLDHTRGSAGNGSHDEKSKLPINAKL